MPRGCSILHLKQITLSFDGARKETFEFYRKGAKFERVRDNFVRFSRMKKERGSKLQIVAQLVRMEGNAAEVDDFIRFWRATPGVDLIRIKEDETNLMRPDAGHSSGDWKHPCHYLWRGAVYVKHNGDVYPCCQSYMLDGAPIGKWRNSRLRRFGIRCRCRRCEGCMLRGAAAKSTCARDAVPRFRIRYWWRQLDAAWTNGAALDAGGGAADLYFEAAFEVTAAA